MAYTKRSMMHYLGEDCLDIDAERFGRFLESHGWQLRLEGEEHVAYRQNEAGAWQRMADDEWQFSVVECFSNQFMNPETGAVASEQGWKQGYGVPSTADFEADLEAGRLVPVVRLPQGKWMSLVDIEPLMDGELRNLARSKGYDNEQTLLDCYCQMHLAKYDREFFVDEGVPAKA